MEEKIIAMLAQMGARMEKMGNEMKEKMGARMDRMDEKMVARNKEMDGKMSARDERMNPTIEEMNEKMDARMEKVDEKIDKQKHDIITSLTEKFQKKVEANQNEITGIKEQMKNIQTNLKVVENLVGENVVLMDQKVKEEVQHQLKSELEKSVECVENRMENKMEDRMKSMENRMESKIKKFEQIMKNAATTGSCYVTSAPRTIQPPTDDDLGKRTKSYSLGESSARYTARDTSNVMRRRYKQI